MIALILLMQTYLYICLYICMYNMCMRAYICVHVCFAIPPPPSIEVDLAGLATTHSHPTTQILKSFLRLRYWKK